MQACIRFLKTKVLTIIAKAAQHVMERSFDAGIAKTGAYYDSSPATNKGQQGSYLLNL